MAAVVCTFDKAPSWARHTSTFARDERCTEVMAIYGPLYDEVFHATEAAFSSHSTAVDRDINKSSETDQWVGIIVEDIDGQSE